MKPKSWRKFYWYRPPSLTSPPKAPAAMERQYLHWLIHDRKLDKVQAEKVIGTQRRAMTAGPILDAKRGDDCGRTYTRKETWIDGRTAVRVVPCFTAAQGKYQPTYFQDSDGCEQESWHQRTGGSGVTTYWIMRDGRTVDTYLTQAAAVAKAKELAAGDDGAGRIREEAAQ
jgi:hypothetical protein